MSYSSEDEVVMTKEEMIEECQRMQAGTFYGGPELQATCKRVLGEILQNLTGPACEICENTGGNHYYRCSRALKCPRCKARIDLPTSEQYPGCTCRSAKVSVVSDNRKKPSQKQETAKYRICKAPVISLRCVDTLPLKDM